MLVPKSTTLAAAFALIAMLANGVSAALTKFDTEYDYRVVRYKASLAIIADHVAIQNGAASAWLKEKFDEVNSKLIKAIDAGEITNAAYDEAITDFYRSTKQRYSDFDITASQALRANPVDTLKYVKAAPESWSDYLFDLFSETAKDLKMTEFGAKIAALQKEVEADIKAKETGANINARLNAFIALEMPKEFATAFDIKREAFLENIDEQDKNPDAVTKAPSTTEPPLTSAPTIEPSLSGSASASSSGSAAPKNTTAPAPAPSSANSIGVVATAAAAVFAVALSTVF